MLVCRDFNLFLRQRSDRAYIGIPESKEEFVRDGSRLNLQLLTRHSTSRHNQGVEENENTVGLDRHRVDSYRRAGTDTWGAVRQN